LHLLKGRKMRTIDHSQSVTISILDYSKEFFSQLKVLVGHITQLHSQDPSFLGGSKVLPRAPMARAFHFTANKEPGVGQHGDRVQSHMCGAYISKLCSVERVSKAANRASPLEFLFTTPQHGTAPLRRMTLSQSWSFSGKLSYSSEMTRLIRSWICSSASDMLGEGEGAADRSFLNAHSIFGSLAALAGSLADEREGLFQSNRPPSSAAVSTSFAGVDFARLLGLDIPDTVKQVVKGPPLLLFCSGALQAIPWELILPSSVIRFPSVSHVYNLGPRRESVSLTPSVNACYFASYDKVSSANDRARIQKLSIRATQKFAWDPTSDYFCDPSDYIGATFPFHCPILSQYRRNLKAQKKKYKSVHFWDLELIENKFEDIQTYLTCDDPMEFPMLVCTYADLAEYGPALCCVQETRPDCTIVFIPASHVKLWVALLGKMSETYNKHISKGTLPGRPLFITDRCQFLMSCVLTFQETHGVPVVVVNGPLP